MFHGAHHPNQASSSSTSSNAATSQPSSSTPASAVSATTVTTTTTITSADHMAASVASLPPTNIPYPGSNNPAALIPAMRLTTAAGASVHTAPHHVSSHYPERQLQHTHNHWQHHHQQHQHQHQQSSNYHSQSIHHHRQHQLNNQQYQQSGYQQQQRQQQQQQQQQQHGYTHTDNSSTFSRSVYKESPHSHQSTASTHSHSGTQYNHQQPQQPQQPSMLATAPPPPYPFHQHQHPSHHHQVHHSRRRNSDSSDGSTGRGPVDIPIIVVSPEMAAAGHTGDSSFAADAGSADGSSGQRRSKRSTTTPFQARHLRAIFEMTRFPSTELRDQIAAVLGMTSRSVQVWFQNQRQRSKVPPNPGAGNPRGNGEVNSHTFDPLANASGMEKAQLYVKELCGQTSPTTASPADMTFSSPPHQHLYQHQQHPHLRDRAVSDNTAASRYPLHNHQPFVPYQPQPQPQQQQQPQQQLQQQQPIIYSPPMSHGPFTPEPASNVAATGAVVTSGHTPMMRRFPMVTIKPYSKSPPGISSTATAALLAAATRDRSPVSPSSRIRRLPDPIPTPGRIMQRDTNSPSFAAPSSVQISKTSTALTEMSPLLTSTSSPRPSMLRPPSALPLQRLMDAMDQNELASTGANSSIESNNPASTNASAGQHRLRPRSTSFQLPPVSSILARTATRSGVSSTGEDETSSEIKPSVSTPATGSTLPAITPSSL